MSNRRIRISDAHLAANATHSTGPKTRKGKRIAGVYMHCEQRSGTFPLNEMYQLGFEFSSAQIHRAVACRKAKSQRAWPTLHSEILFREMQAA